MSRTREIPRTQWVDFIHMLERKLMDEPVRLEVMSRDIGDQQVTRVLPLRELELELRGTERAVIDLALGDDRGELGHRIESPHRIAVVEDDAGQVQCVAIEQEGGGTTLLYLEQPRYFGEQLPESQAPAS